MSGQDLWRLKAREAVRLLERGEVSPLELVEAALKRIERVDPQLNALPTLCAERARAAARRMMQEKPTLPGDGRGWLHGLPVVIKDLGEVEGVRTTFGSPIYADHLPDRSALQVERLEAHGAIVLGKSNTPEFGAGANTFNEVFGSTLNPFDPRLTCGGSSGGAAVALATGMAWLADGSDLGGSLRTPAAFCSIVGLRPSPGRVPSSPSPNPFQTLSVKGPMARDVRDLALMLDAMAGFEPFDPLSFEAPDVAYVEEVERTPAVGQVAFSADLGGITPVDREVAAICARAAARITELGGILIEDACPDLTEAPHVFDVLRAALFVTAHGPLLESHRERLKPEVVWNIERGLALSADAIGRAERARGIVQQRMAAFFESYDALLCPAAICPPFPVEHRYLAQLGDHRFETYIDWLVIASAITLSGCPALSLPCGFTAAGLPVGLQIVGPPRGEARLLAMAAALEDRLEVAARVPLDPQIPD